MVIEDKEHAKGFYPKNTKILNFTLNALKHYHHLSKDYQYYLGVGFYPVDARFVYERPINTENKEVLITLGGSEQKTLKEIVKILENKNVNLHIISPYTPKKSSKKHALLQPFKPLRVQFFDEILHLRH